jgi:hypothetical protein
LATNWLPVSFLVARRADPMVHLTLLGVAIATMLDR